jgi:hypothetical protein
MQSDKTIKQITYLLKLFVKQKFEDTKEIIRSRNSKTERQYNGQKDKYI